ncbi:early growth response protein 1 (egr-1) [Stagonosporopsis vannaccii]|nr:early growth response protein 1 (egr-1) [Stagonosporopsis vannaccii]
MASVSMTPDPPERRPSFQPFQCQICQSRFTRHENLKRHAALHAPSQDEASLTCDFCSATFSRSDLRRRHVKRKHPEHQANRPRKRQTLQSDRSPSGSRADLQTNLSFVTPEEQGDFDVNGVWQTALLQLDTDHLHNAGSIAVLDNPMAPVSITTRSLSVIDNALQGMTASESELASDTTQKQPPQFSSTYGNTDSLNQCSPSRWSSAGSPQMHDTWDLTTTQIARGTDLFFTHLSPTLPFIHQPTFNTDQADKRLMLGMLSLGYQYGEDPDHEEQIGSGATLSMQCFHRARVLLRSDNDDEEIDIIQSTATIQACLLLQVYTTMYLCGRASAYGLKLHSRIISLARANGLMQPLTVEATTTTGLEALWHQFIEFETHKRTCFAVHQIDALWYQVLSVPRSLSHLEIKQDLPCPEDQWTAATSGAWAHKQLLSRRVGPAVHYPEVVRRFLSSNADLCSLPPFDPFGTINITQFLISSAREISGWSSITGILSVERFEPLRLSLVALEPFTRPHGENSNPALASLSEIAWETAMIELQMWSPTHTGGIIAGSMDSVLQHMTEHAPSCEFLCQSRIKDLVQPHVDWFLRYLDATIMPDTEAPWVVLYAYQAFVIAWQLVRDGIVGSMQVVGVEDGNTEGALAWARKVFGRRQRWQLGKIVLKCIDQLEAGTSPG